MEKLSGKIFKGINSVHGMDTSLLIVCAGALGMLIGMNINSNIKRIFSVFAVFIFISASIPAVSKIAGKMLENDSEDYFTDDDCIV